MDQARMFLVRHPVAAALLMAAVVGACGYNAFQAGMDFAELRARVGQQAQAASEALGG